MNWQIKNGKIVISVEPDDAEELREGITEFLIELAGDRFPLLDELQSVLENGIEATLGLPLFPRKKR
jgi:hypothetical protein